MAKWIDAQTLEFEGIRFRLDLSGEPPGDGEDVVLMKDVQLVEDYLDALEGTRAGNALELGIWAGGSAIFFHRLLRPGKLVSIELETTRAPALDRYIREMDLEARIVPYYGVSQADAGRLREIVASEFGGAPLDIVIDDGSHELDNTLSAFNALFPLVRERGLYIIEDWGWAHWRGRWQEPDGPWSDQPALSNMVFEITMALATRRLMITRVDMRPGFVAVRKGPEKLDTQRFDLSASYLSRGKRLDRI